MRIAFYAPLKPMDHPVPSGDRLMARAFFGLLEALGHEVTVASRLRSFDRSGDPANQLALRAAAESEAARLKASYGQGEAPELWFTYHAYHKAPDWLGPALSRALDIPYVVAEASIAGKQAGGPWDLGHRATIEAVNEASAVLAMTAVDARNVAKYLTEPSKLVLFPPFLSKGVERRHDRTIVRSSLAYALGLPDAAVWLATVAMMRNDIKARSYALLAEALGRVARQDWRLLVVGAGPAAPEIRSMLEAVGGGKVRFLGELPGDRVAELLQAADIFAWPGLAEAYGMAILEALAAGLPVVACEEGGIGDLVTHGQNGFLAPGRSAELLAAHLDRLIADVDLRRRLGDEAKAGVAVRHSAAAAETRLQSVLQAVTTGTVPLPCN
jgi:glycosyltransferase involved in cell wall biosynthesis